MKITHPITTAIYGAMGILLLVPTGRSAAPTVVAVDQRRTSFNADWRFLKGDAAGAEQPQFDDSAWRLLRLPHDWAIEGPFEPPPGIVRDRAAA